MTNEKAVVIGYGNPLREDDRMGPRAAEILEQRIAPGSAEIICCHQLTPELAARLDRARLVIFLDAASDLDPGSVTFQAVAASTDTGWSHHLSPSRLLEISCRLGTGPHRAFLIRGGAARIDLGEELTEIGEKTATGMASLAQALLTGALTA